MSEEKDEFSGITLMTPEETNTYFSDESKGEPSEETTTDEEVENGKPDDKEEEPVLEIVPPSADDAPTDTKIEDDDKPTPVSTKEEKVVTNKYGAFIKDLIKDGVLSEVEEEKLDELLKDASIETLKELMSSTVNNTFIEKQKEWKDSLSPTQKRFLDIEDSFTESDNAMQMAQRLEFFDNISEDAIMEDENMQKNIYFDFLKSKGFSNAEATEAIDDAIAIDKLGSKAISSIPKLKQDALSTIENAKNLKIAEQEKITKINQEKYNLLMTNIDNKEAFIPGLDLNKTSREKLKNNITKPVYKDDKGKAYTSILYKQMRNPAGFEMILNYFDTIGLFNLDKEGNFKPDITKLKNVAKTKAVSELEQVLKREEDLGPGRGNSNSVSEQSSNILELLERADKSKKRKR